MSNRYLYRVYVDNSGVVLYEIPILKQTDKTYGFEPSKGTMYMKRVDKNNLTCFQLTKDAALNYFIDRKLDEQMSLAKKIKDNEAIIKQAESLLKGVDDVAKR